MKPAWRLPAEGFVEQELSGRAREQVFAPHHLLDLHGVVVGHHGQFVGGEIVAPPDHEVAEVAARRASDSAQAAVVKFDHAAVGHAKPPGHAARGRCSAPRGRTQGRGKDGVGLGGRGVWRRAVRSQGGFFDVAA